MGCTSSTITSKTLSARKRKHRQKPPTRPERQKNDPKPKNHPKESFQNIQQKNEDPGQSSSKRAKLEPGQVVKLICKRNSKIFMRKEERHTPSQKSGKSAEEQQSLKKKCSIGSQNALNRDGPEADVPRPRRRRNKIERSKSTCVVINYNQIPSRLLSNTPSIFGLKNQKIDDKKPIKRRERDLSFKTLVFTNQKLQLWNKKSSYKNSRKERKRGLGGLTPGTSIIKGKKHTRKDSFISGKQEFKDFLIRAHKNRENVFESKNPLKPKYGLRRGSLISSMNHLEGKGIQESKENQELSFEHEEAKKSTSDLVEDKGVKLLKQRPISGHSRNFKSLIGMEIKKGLFDSPNTVGQKDFKERKLRSRYQSTREKLARRGYRKSITPNFVQDRIVLKVGRVRTSTLSNLPDLASIHQGGSGSFSSSHE